MSTVALRPLECRDLEFVCEVRHHPETLPHLHDQRVFSIEEVRQWFVEHKPEWLVVEIEGRKVGYVRISDKDRTGQCLKVGMDIHPSFRRNGIASAAYEALFQRLGAEGWKLAWLEVLSGNSAARALYENLGFSYTPDSDRVLECGGKPQVSMAMSRTLASSKGA